MFRRFFGIVKQLLVKQQPAAVLEVYDEDGNLTNTIEYFQAIHSAEIPDEENFFVGDIEDEFTDEEFDTLFHEWNTERVDWKKEGF